MSRPSVSGVLRKDTTHLRASAAGGGSAATPKAGTLSSPAETRRRLSVMRSPGMTDGFIDGANENGQASIAALVQSSAKGSTSRSCFKSYVAKSKVGYMQFNPGKVNQDRAMEVPKVGGRDDRSLFGVFDGHGVNGHGVSEFLMNRMPQFLLAQRNLEEETTDAFISSFAATSDALIKSPIDCTFSGSTGVCVLLNRRKIICGNVGDSRAVLASVDAKGKLKAIALSDDHKPDRPDEMKRILENRGRVEACQSPQGPVGPARVWLLNDDVPGLAMSRSFGDLIAASVGVTPEPEILEHDVRPCDKYIIMGSDGIWEFISSQEAVDMVVESKSIQEACDRLVDEATRRWKHEEDVIDDITCIVIELNGDEEPAAPAPSHTLAVPKLGSYGSSGSSTSSSTAPTSSMLGYSSARTSASKPSPSPMAASARRTVPSVSSAPSRTSAVTSKLRK